MPIKTPLAICLLLSLALAGCRTPVHTYREVDLPDKTFGDIWVTLQLVTRQLGYAADRNETDRGKRVFQSTWETQLTGTARTSTRHRVRAEVDRIRPEQSGWRVRCYVEKQRVGTLGHGIDPVEEDWEPAGQDPYLENTFIGTLRGKLGLGVVEPKKDPAGKEPARIR